MPATRIRAAAVQALQLALLVLCLLPLWPLWWAIFSIFGVLTVARGLRNTDSYPGPHWLKWPLAVVSLPLKLAAGLAWTLYAVLTLTIHPFTLHGLAPKLESVSFTHGSNGDEHAKALAAAFSSGRMPD
jgi:hypothetical protein